MRKHSTRSCAAATGVAAVLSVFLFGTVAASAAWLPPFLSRQSSASQQAHARVPVANRPNWISPRALAAAKTTGLVFVTDSGTGYFTDHGAVDIFARGDLTTPIGTITSGIDYPISVALDGKRHLYVANAHPGAGPGSTYVVEYAAPYTAGPIRTYSIGGTPLDVTAASDGTLYVSVQGGGVLVYPPNSNGSPTIVNGNANLVNYQVAIDAQRNVYIGSGCACTNYYTGTPEIDEIPAGQSTYTNLGLQGLNGIGGMAFATNGDFIVESAADIGFQSSIELYAQGATTPYRTLTPPGLLVPWSLAFDKLENRLYVGNVGNNNVEELSYPEGNVLRRFVGSVNQGIGSGVAVSPPAPH